MPIFGLLRRLYYSWDIEFVNRLLRPFEKVPVISCVRRDMALWRLLSGRLTLELGSERGFGSYGIPNCIRTDIRPIEGLHVICDATCLPFRDRVFDRSWCVYLAHHIPDLRGLIDEAKRVSRKFYMFDFLPGSWLHYFSIVWDIIFFHERPRPVPPEYLRRIAPDLRSYKQCHLGGVLYAF